MKVFSHGIVEGVIEDKYGKLLREQKVLQYFWRTKMLAPLVVVSLGYIG